MSLGSIIGSSPCTLTKISAFISYDASATLSVPVKQESDVIITLYPDFFTILAIFEFSDAI